MHLRSTCVVQCNAIFARPFANTAVIIPICIIQPQLRQPEVAMTSCKTVVSTVRYMFGDQLSHTSSLFPKPSPVKQVVVVAIVIFGNTFHVCTMYLCTDSANFVIKAPCTNTHTRVLLFCAGATIL